MTMRQEIEAELETIRGIRITRWNEHPKYGLHAEVIVTTIEPSVPLPPFPKLEADLPEWAWWLAVLLMLEFVFWMAVR